MTEPAQLLEEAGGTLARAQALIERAGSELGAPFDGALRLLAEDVERLRRRVRRAGVVVGTGMGGGVDDGTEIFGVAEADRRRAPPGVPGDGRPAGDRDRRRARGGGGSGAGAAGGDRGAP